MYDWPTLAANHAITILAAAAPGRIPYLKAAVSVQGDRGDYGRTRGRISVHFKSVDRWVQRHESMWGHGSHSAKSRLAAYEATVRPMLASGSWDKEAVKACIAQVGA